MDYAEFHELTRSMVELLKPRIDEKWWPALDIAVEDGEGAFAVEDLVHTVVEDRIPVSAEELANLRSLAGEHWHSEEILAKLEQVKPK